MRHRLLPGPSGEPDRGQRPRGILLREVLRNLDKRHGSTTRDTFLLLDDDARYVDASAAAATLLGYTRRELLGLGIVDLVSEDRRPGALALWRRFLDTGSLEGEYTVRRKDGTSRHVAFRATANVLPGVHLSAVRDISARKRVEDELRESEERARTQFRCSPVPTYAWREIGGELVLSDYNDAAAAITQGKVEKLLGATARATYADSPEILADFARCLGERVTVRRRMEYRLRSTGEDRHMAVTYGFVPAGTVLVHTEDETERHRAEEAVQARARQQAAVARLGQLALEGLDVPSLFTSAVTLITQTLGVAYGAVMEQLPSERDLLLRAGTGWSPGSVGSVVSGASRSQASFTLASPDPVIVEDLRTETRFEPTALLLEHGVASGISVRVPAEEGCFGTLSAFARERRDFTEDDALFLQAIANVLATAVIRKREEGARAGLLHRVFSAQDEERRRIARELHDETSQALTSLLVGLRAVQECRSLEEARAGAERLRSLAARTIEDLARLTRGLHPTVLDDLGLASALTRFVQEHERLYPFAVRLDTKGLRPERLDPDTETALYRMVQEALTNVHRHAFARTVEITLTRGPDSVELAVRDDGIGFETSRALSAAHSASRLGLIGILERSALLGGAARIDSRPGEGTALTIRLPAESGSER